MGKGEAPTPFSPAARLAAHVRQVHVVLEVRDARAPLATASPLWERPPFSSKPRLVVLTRADLADPKATSAWLSYFGQGAAVDARRGTGMAALLGQLRRLRPGPVRAMVVGLPNVGKSSLVNRLAGRVGAATGDRPGVTRGEQWIQARPWLRVLDQPGVVPPRHPHPYLAALGVLPEGAYDPVQVWEALWAQDPVQKAVARRWGVGTSTPHEALRALAARWGAVAAGGEVDMDRAARQALTQLRQGSWGRLSLEWPPHPEA